MKKYKNCAVIYYKDSFDKNAFYATAESIVNQTGNFSNNIFCYAIVPEKFKDEPFDELTADHKNNFEYIYSSDPKDELRKRLMKSVSEYTVTAEIGDVFSEEAFSSAYECFENVKGSCDIVGLFVNDENKKYVNYNKGFGKEAGKIYHLAEHYNRRPADLKGLFIKSNVAAEKAARQKKGFDEIRFLTDILSRRNVFATAAPSACITPNTKEIFGVSPDVFESRLDSLNEISNGIISSNGFIPLYIQDIILCAVMECLNNSEDTANAYHISHYDFNSMWDKLHLLLENIDGSVIMKLSTTRFNKLFLLKEKYGKYCGFDFYYNDMKIMYAVTPTYNLSSFPVIIDLIDIDGGRLMIEGICHVPACIDIDAYSVKAFINGKPVDAQMIERYSDRFFYDKIYLKEAGFRLEIPLNDFVYEIKIADFVQKNICIKNVYIFSNICSLGDELDDEYYYKDGYVVNFSENAIICRRCDEKARRFWEENLRFTIRRNEPNRADEIIEIRDYYWENYKNKTKQIWLITDRPDRADDNGEAFFRYMTERNEEDIDLYFVLSKDSGAYEELSSIGQVIEPFSAEHKKLHLLADYIISSQMAEAVYNPFNDDVKYFRGLFRNPKQVFLQHGVINNEHGGKFFSRYGRDFCGFVVSAQEEYNYMREPKFHYTHGEVWLTGLPRWDRLYRNDKKIITIMPTWRKYLTTRTFDEEAGTKIWKVNDNFTDTDYFKFYNGIINDEKLLDAADKYGYTICFMPHVIFLKETDKFDRNDRAVIYDYEKSYREIYAESSLIVTDFSSAVFDFAYMRQPIVYCQFDKDRFYLGHSYTKGYFDHERDGFGEVTYDSESLVNVLTEYMADGCQLKPKYRKRIDEFFSFNDKKCCERVYEKIRDSEDPRSRE